ALCVNEKGIENYLEGVGKGFKIINNPIPFVTIPTTAGSGAEVTKNAVITSYPKKYKKSFRDDRLLAKVVIADPLLTISLPSDETRFGGMDAVCQLIESYTTKKNNSFCNALSIYHIPRAIKTIISLMNDPNDIILRTQMLEASLSSGITLASSGLGAVHGFASGLGGMFNIPHGLICAILLPHIVRLNSTRNSNLYKNISLITDGSGDSFKFSHYLYKINSKLNIPTDFKQFNINKNLSKEIVERSKGGSMNGNPVDFNDEELINFIESII
ncbi:MAG TPA: iron-containing alcohol dehydrogenase, partial [Spirochaetota bacterium]|nr:iron-containing alcohol dehydrogenase [Spirochaetota bacterium]